MSQVRQSQFTIDTVVREDSLTGSGDVDCRDAMTKRKKEKKMENFDKKNVQLTELKMQKKKYKIE